MKRAMMALAALALSVSAAFAQQAPQLQPGEKLEKLQFPGATMELKGWTKFGNSRVYTLPVKAGQHVRISFSTKSQFAFLAIFDLAQAEDEAIFGTDEDGDAYTVTVKANTTWLLRPYYSKASPRRGLGAPYSILIEPQATAQPQTPPPASAPQDDENKGPSPLFPLRR